MWAARMNGNSGVVEALLAAGADLNAKNRDGKTALEIARKQGNADVTALLSGYDRDSRRRLTPSFQTRTV